MGVKPTKFYNEPTVKRGRDVTPRFPRLVTRSLGAIVRARLELEHHLRVCGLDNSEKAIAFTPRHQRVLLAMLVEADSPLSSSLRARAAGVAGALRLAAAGPLLRRLALDENEDLQTRLNAVYSYIWIRGNSAIKDFRKLFQSKEILVRTSAYLAALQSKAPRVVTAAEEHLKKERNPTVRGMITRRVPRLQRIDMTKADNKSTSF
jgi:hypothetical protein